MTKRATSQGKCGYCNKTFGKASMTRHLKTCRGKHASSASGKKQRGFYFQVVGSPMHWMYLALCADDSLALLDSFLRATWLECCGHLSDFKINGVTYSATEAFMDSPWGDESNDENIDVPIGKVLRVGTTFTHTYDYGSTTELKLKVVDEGEALLKKNSVFVEARNEPPTYGCQFCNKNDATFLCTECKWDGKGLMCSACAKKHECGEEMMLPVVDSPRMGVCGYTG